MTLNRQKLLDYVAPCSLLCYTCPGLKGGAVSESARELHSYLDGFYDFNAGKHSAPENDPWLKELAVFHTRLATFAASDCPG